MKIVIYTYLILTARCMLLVLDAVLVELSVAVAELDFSSSISAIARRYAP